MKNMLFITKHSKEILRKSKIDILETFEFSASISTPRYPSLSTFVHAHMENSLRAVEWETEGKKEPCLQMVF